MGRKQCNGKAGMEGDWGRMMVCCKLLGTVWVENRTGPWSLDG